MASVASAAVTVPVSESEPVTEDLAPWGYAPGSGLFRCRDCFGQAYKIGHRFSTRCPDHARALRDQFQAFQDQKIRDERWSYRKCIAFWFLSAGLCWSGIIAFLMAQ